MSPIQPVSRARHAAKRWLRFKSYDFAKNDAIAPIVFAELPKAMHSFPIGFVKDGESFVPVAVLGLQRGLNLYLGPDGKWIGGYVPASLRGYPFRIGETTEGELLLCIDENSGLLTEGPEGEAFFSDGGDLTETVAKISDFLSQTYRNRSATLKICKILADKGLIIPWQIKVKSEEQEQSLEGLYCIDENSLNALEMEHFDEIRRAGALPLVYSQLLSMQHMSLLGQLAKAHAQRAAMMAKSAPQVPDLTKSLSTSENIDWSKFGM